MGICLGISAITTPLAIAYLIVNSSQITYSNAETQIELRGKELSETEREKQLALEKQIQSLIAANAELRQAAKRQKVDRVLAPQIQKIELEEVKSQVRLEDSQEASKELSQFVEEAIAQE